MPMRLVKLQISNFCFRFPFKHPDAIKQIEPSSKTAYAAPYQGLPVSHITWEGCCLHKQKKLTPSLLGFTSNFAGDCSSLQRYIAMQSRERYIDTALQRYTRTSMGWLNPNPRTLPAVPESAPARIWRLKISRAIRRYSFTALPSYGSPKATAASHQMILGQI